MTSINKKATVVIAGAGPSGSMAAIELLKRKINNVVIVDRVKLPRQKPCAGGISPATVKFLKKINMKSLLQECKTAVDMGTLRFVGPDGSDNIFSGGLKAQVINRKDFDTVLLQKAIDMGAEFISDFTLRELIKDDKGTVTGIKDGNKIIHSDVTIVATGGHNKAMRENDFPDKRPLKRMVSRIGWWKNFDLEDGHLEMIFDKELLPHYGWVFPEKDNIVNIGLCIYEDNLNGKTITEIFDNFLDKYYKDRLKNAELIGKILSYPINTDSSVTDVAAPGLLLCGEAGRMCNPATAEGISFALESGYLAAESIAEALKDGEIDQKKLMVYEKKCKKAFNLRLRGSAVFSYLVTTRFFTALISLGSNRLVKKVVDRIIPA
jgi:geranylgeranyl reductase family protein